MCFQRMMMVKHQFVNAKHIEDWVPNIRKYLGLAPGWRFLITGDYEDLRIMIGQNIGLDYLIPLALETFEDNILSEGDFYCGDLLDAVLKVSKEFWKSNPTYKNELIDILGKNIKDLVSKLDLFRQG